MTPRRVGLGVMVPLVGLLVGIVITLASSLASLSPDRVGETSGFVEPSPRIPPSPSPMVTAPGLLGSSGRLLTNGSNTIIAVGSNLAVGSADGGHSWMVVRVPANGSGLAIDPRNPAHAITGGSSIQVTTDGGSNWTAPISPPPGKPPYQPLAISPTEANVWFFVHGSKLLLTQNGSATWTEQNLQQLNNAVLVTGQAPGQFFLASGTGVFELTNNGQTITPEPTMGAAVSELAAVGGQHPTLLARVTGQGVYRLQGSAWLPTGRGLRGPIASGAGGTMLVGNGGTTLDKPGAISFSTDGGITWSSATGLPFDQTVEAITGGFDSRTFFAYCYGGDLYVSTDAGRSWSLLTNRLRSP